MVPGMFTGLRRHAHIVILKCFYHPKRKLASAGSHPASTPPPHAWVLAVCSSTSCFCRFTIVCTSNANDFMLCTGVKFAPSIAAAFLLLTRALSAPTSKGIDD